MLTFNPIALTMPKTLLSFGHFVCTEVNILAPDCHKIYTLIKPLERIINASMTKVEIFHYMKNTISVSIRIYVYLSRL